MEPTKSEGSIKATSKSKKDPAVSVYNFGEVDLPVASEKSYEDFVTYGEDNLFPQSLITAWQQSSTHNAITSGIIQMIAGHGLKFDTPIAELEKFKMKINRKGETLDELINKTAFDLYLQGYYGWQIVWNQARTQIVEIYHTPAEQIRTGKANDLGMVEDYYVSWDWSQYRKKKFAPTKIPAFNLLDRSEGRQMIFVKQYRPNQYYYSTPSYIGGMNWILMDNRVGEFHLNNIDNGFFPSSVVQFFNGEPPQEEKRKIEMGFMDKFTGKKQAKIVFVYNNNQDERVSFDTYEPANIDKRFRDLMPEISKNIMIAHRVPSPLLFGVREGGGLGNNAEELESSSLLMNKMVIVPFQQMIIETLAEIFKVNAWDTDMSIDTLQPGQFLDGDEEDAEAKTGDEPDEIPEGEKKVGKVPKAKALAPKAKAPATEGADVAKQALNGAQISSLLEITTNVSTGALSPESAKAIIGASFPTFTPLQINAVVDNIVPAPVTEFGKDDRMVMPVEMIKPLLEHLDSVGITETELREQGYELVLDEGELTVEGIKRRLRPDMFAVTPDVSTVKRESSDPGFYIIRYQYRPGQGEQAIIETTRDFCDHMMTVNAAKLYSHQEINQMSFQGANPEFGTYSIFKYKGSYNCRHRWARMVWFRTGTNTGQVKGYRKLHPDEVPVGMRPPNDDLATEVNPKVVPK